MSFGAGTAAGSFGQFLFSPLAIAMIGQFGWQNTLLIFAAVLLTMLPLSLALAAPPGSGCAPVLHAPGGKARRRRWRKHFGHRSYVLLVLGYFTCGFQLFFITVHLPAIWSSAACRCRSAAGPSR